MSNSDTEEKKHDATPSKLRRARRDGHVPHAQDVLTLSALPIILWLIFTWESLEASLRRLLALALHSNFRASPGDVTALAFAGILQDAFWIAMPFLLVSVVVGVLVAIVDNVGFIFSGKPITPNFSRINPAEGFKRIFSTRTAVESVYNLVKFSLLAGVVVFLFAVNTEELVAIQSCGDSCLPLVFDIIIYPMLAIFIALFLVAAIIDFIISRRLFAREMKMSHTELKNDNKEVYGNPDFRRRRRSEGRAAMEGPRRMGLGASTILFDTGEGLVGLRYVPAELPAPVAVFKAYGPLRPTALAEARRIGVPIVFGSPVGDSLIERTVVGGVIPRETFTEVAKELLSRDLA